MKQLIAGVVIVLILGIGGFLYRNVMEHQGQVASSTTPTACTLEAKVCPDGTSVGRTGPPCEFSKCAPPNAEDAEIGIAFVVPTGYVANADAIGADPTLRAVFDKPSKGPVPHTIVIRRYPIPAGKTANDVILANTMYESSGNMAKSMKEFSPVIADGKTFQSVTLERFEGQVHSAYYLARTNDVLKFEILEKDVNDWTDPNLNLQKLPEHQAILEMLATLQSTQ